MGPRSYPGAIKKFSGAYLYCLTCFSRPRAIYLERTDRHEPVPSGELRRW